MTDDIKAKSRFTRKNVGEFLLAWAILGVGGGYYLYNYIKKEQRAEAILQENQEKRDAAKALAKLWNADTEWVDRLLQGKSHRSSPVYLYEIKEAWTRSHYILFPGAISQVEHVSDSTYAVSVVYDSKYSSKFNNPITATFLLNDDNVKLIESFRGRRDSFLEPSVFLIAHMENVKSIKNVTESLEGDTIEGRGVAVAAVYLGNAPVYLPKK